MNADRDATTEATTDRVEGGPVEGGPVEGGSAAPAELPPLVDFVAMGRRLGRTAAVLGAMVVVAFVATVPFRGADVAMLMNLVGAALALMFVAEVVIVGGSAVKGLLRAGERGERLASQDVGLLPPQVARRLGRQRD